MRVYKFVLLFSIGIYLFLFTRVVLASVSSVYYPSDGSDASSATSANFFSTDINKLSSSDDNRIQSNGPWSNSGEYDESKYIEFIFSPNIPANALIESASITHKFHRSGAMSEAKIEVWDGTSFVNQNQTVGTINIDHTDVVDVFSFINTPEKVNNLKVRFLAYRSGTSNTTTSHDYISLSVVYSIPATLDSITISTPANKISYLIGDILDISGLAITGTYSDLSTKIESFSVSNVTGFDSSQTLSRQVLTVSIGGKFATYNVDIVDPNPNGNNSSGGSGSAPGDQPAINPPSVVEEIPDVVIHQNSGHPVSAGVSAPVVLLVDTVNKVEENRFPNPENKIITISEVQRVNNDTPKIVSVNKKINIDKSKTKEAKVLVASVADSVDTSDFWDGVKSFFKWLFRIK